jgi:hypothetical protein
LGDFEEPIMRASVLAILAATVSVAVAGGEPAQTPAPSLRGGNKAELLQNDSVQRELKLTAEQMEKLKALAKDFETRHKDEIARLTRDKKDVAAFLKLRQAAMEHFSTELPKVLTEEQLKRLDQIEMQLHGVQGLMRVDVQSDLKLTDTQRKAILEVLENLKKDAQTTMDSAKASSDKKEEVGRRITQLHKLATEKAFNLLTEEQKKAWTGLVGEPFELKAKVPAGKSSGGDKDRPK